MLLDENVWVKGSQMNKRAMAPSSSSSSCTATFSGWSGCLWTLRFSRNAISTTGLDSGRSFFV